MSLALALCTLRCFWTGFVDGDVSASANVADILGLFLWFPIWFPAFVLFLQWLLLRLPFETTFFCFWGEDGWRFFGFCTTGGLDVTVLVSSLGTRTTVARFCEGLACLVINVCFPPVLIVSDWCWAASSCDADSGRRYNGCATGRVAFTGVPNKGTSPIFESLTLLLGYEFLFL